MDKEIGIILFVQFYKTLCPFFDKRGLEVILLDVLEIVYGTNLELYGSGVVTYDDAVGVELKHADGPHLSDGAFNCVVESLSLVVTVGEDEHLLGIHHCAYAYGNGGLGHLVHVVVEET